MRVRSFALVVGTMRVRSFALVVALGAALLDAGCGRTGGTPLHREHDPGRDRECKDPTRPRAFFYPAENRTDYRPDHPERDGCELLVADHLFCCPDVKRATDR